MQKPIEVSKIFSKSNVRNEKDDSILELAESIDKNGLLQPIVVRKVGAKYEVIAGHRRLEAVKSLGEPFIECVIMEDVNDQERLIMQLEENIQRKQMSAYELVCSFNALVEKYGWTDVQIAKKLHKSKQWIYDNRYAVKLLEREYAEAGSIPEEKKKLSAGVIKAQNRHKGRADAVTITGKGFSCRHHDHSYIFYCHDFTFEQKLNELINKFQEKKK